MDKIENGPTTKSSQLLVEPAPPALPPEHIKMPEPKKSNKPFVIILIAVVLCIAATVTALILAQKDISSQNPPDTEIQSNTYKVRYDFGKETYIYLMPDNTIKVVSRSEIYATQPSCNCMKPTGEYKEEETAINFNDEVKAQVIAVVKDLAQKAGSYEFNADQMELTSYQEKVLLATVMDFQDWLTLEKDLTVIHTATARATYDLIDADNTENPLVINAAKFINPIVEADYAALKEDGKYHELKLELAYVGPFYYSITYTDQTNEDHNIYSKKGYVFNGNGDIKEFDALGITKDYHTKALESFRQSDYYAKNKDQLISNWEQALYDNMFKTGNWYQVEGGVTFVLPGSALGVTNSNPRVFEIFIKTDGDP